MQRYYNIVCLTYGGDPKRRADFAKEMGLPEARAKLCDAEFRLAKNSWGPIIDRIAAAKSGEPVHFGHSARTAMQRQAASLIEAEIKTINEKFNLPKRLRVTVKRCERGRNLFAFYSSGREKITICTNYIDDLYRDAPK